MGSCIMRAFRWRALCLTLAAYSASGVLLPTSARAQGVGTGIQIDVDPALELTCVDKISFAPTPAELAQVVTGTSSANGEVTRSSTPTSVSVVGSANSLAVALAGLQTGINSLSLTQSALDICLVRATALRFGNYQVSVGLRGNPQLNGPGNSRIRVTDVRTRPGFSTGGYGPQFSVNWLPLLFLYGGQFTVDVELDFDLDNADRPGVHQRNGNNGVFVVTATAP